MRWVGEQEHPHSPGSALMLWRPLAQLGVAGLHLAPWTTRGEGISRSWTEVGTERAVLRRSVVAGCVLLVGGTIWRRLPPHLREVVGGCRGSGEVRARPGGLRSVGHDVLRQRQRHESGGGAVPQLSLRLGWTFPRRQLPVGRQLAGPDHHCSVDTTPRPVDKQANRNRRANTTSQSPPCQPKWSTPLPVSNAGRISGRRSWSSERQDMLPPRYPPTQPPSSQDPAAIPILPLPPQGAQHAAQCSAFGRTTRLHQHRRAPRIPEKQTVAACGPNPAISGARIRAPSHESRYSHRPIRPDTIHDATCNRKRFWANFGCPESSFPSICPLFGTAEGSLRLPATANQPSSSFRLYKATASQLIATPVPDPSRDIW